MLVVVMQTLFPSRHKYLGKAGSEAYLKAVAMVRSRSQLEGWQQALNTRFYPQCQVCNQLEVGNKMKVLAVLVKVIFIYALFSVLVGSPQHLFMLRIPILTGSFLFLPFLARKNLFKSLLRNIFILDSREQLVLVIASAITAALAVTNVFFLGYEKYLLDITPWWQEHWLQEFFNQDILKFLSTWWQHLQISEEYIYLLKVVCRYVIVILLSLPICCAVYFRSSTEIKREDRQLGIRQGVLLGLAVINFFVFSTDFIEAFPLESYLSFFRLDNNSGPETIVTTSVLYLTIFFVYVYFLCQLLSLYVQSQPVGEPKLDGKWKLFNNRTFCDLRFFILRSSRIIFKFWGLLTSILFWGLESKLDGESTLFNNCDFRNFILKLNRIIFYFWIFLAIYFIYQEQDLYINELNKIWEISCGFLFRGRGLPDQSSQVYPFITLTVAIILRFLAVWFFSEDTLSTDNPNVKNKHSEKGKYNEVPTLFYLLVIVTVVTLPLGVLTFFLDKYRIPVFILFVIISALIYRKYNVDHYYELRGYKETEAQSKSQDEIDLKVALTHRLRKKGNPNQILVVICASGGGIQASGWTVKVLTGLQNLLGKEFIQAIGLISSVSGGSVGTMYYLDHFNEDACPSKDDFDEIFRSSTNNSLNSTGWGLAYPDLWRFFWFPSLAEMLNLGDRGTAIEMEWKVNLKNSHNPPTLGSSWRKKVLDGEIPIPVFNATLVENGFRLLLSPVTFMLEPQSQDSERKFFNFNRLYDEYDIDATTAARLSATFPYVTPICRNPKNTKHKHTYHVADGGYFDNFGVCTSVEILDKMILNGRKEELSITKVILLKINAFHESHSSNVDSNSQSSPNSKKSQNNDYSKAEGWLMSLAGPLIAAFNVRNSTQTARNQLDIELLKQKWKKEEVEIEDFNIDFPRICESEFSRILILQIPLNKIPIIWLLLREFNCLAGILYLHSALYSDFYQEMFVDNNTREYLAPLSWKLTSFEKMVIQYAWENTIKNGQELKRLEDTWKGWNKS